MYGIPMQLALSWGGPLLSQGERHDVLESPSPPNHEQDSFALTHALEIRRHYLYSAWFTMVR